MSSTSTNLDAGTVEDWRSDAKDFPAGDVGKVLPEWPNERWIRSGSTKVRDIMAKRIKLAGDKGCDAIDPDNIGTLFKCSHIGVVTNSSGQEAQCIC